MVVAGLFSQTRQNPAPVERAGFCWWLLPVLVGGEAVGELAIRTRNTVGYGAEEARTGLQVLIDQ